MFTLFRKSDDVIDRTSSIIKDNVTSISEKVNTMTDSLPNIPASSLPVLETAQTITQTNYTMYFIIFIILTLIGVNVFGYVAIIVDSLESIFGEPFRKFLIMIGYNTNKVVKQTVNASADGTKFAVDIVKDVTNNTVDEIGTQAKNVMNNVKEIDKAVDAEIVKKSLESSSDEIPYIDRTELMMSFDKVKKKQFADREATKNYVEDDAGSTIQSSGPSSGKSGWCYIGEDRGFRSCMEVGANHECMSGDIFPSKQICVNPSLRE